MQNRCVQTLESFALLHISDTHIEPGSGDAAEVQLSSILSEHPDLPVLITGDLAAGGDGASYQKLREILRGRTYLCCPGNHDNVDNLRAALGDLRVLDTPAVRIVSIDSSQPGAVFGRIRQEDLAHAERAIVESDRPCLLALHHPPDIFAAATVPGVLLEPGSSQALAEVLQKHVQAVLGVVCGHLHQPMLAMWSGVPVFVAPSSAYHLKLYGGELYKTGTGGGYAIHRVSRGILVSTVETLAPWEPTEETLRRRKTRMT